MEGALFLSGSVVKNLPANAGNSGDMGLIPGLGRSPGDGNDNPFQYSCLKNPMDRGASWTTVHGTHKESDMAEHKHKDGEGLWREHGVAIAHKGLSEKGLSLIMSFRWFISIYWCFASWSLRTTVIPIGLSPSK